MIDLSVISTVIIVANVLIGISIVFFERRDPTTALAWLLILLLVPYLGFVLYLLFGQRYHKQKLFRDKVENDRFLQQYLLKEKGESVDQSITAPVRCPRGIAR
jgi:cardiolipin synthase A/B